MKFAEAQEFLLQNYFAKHHCHFGFIHFMLPLCYKTVEITLLLQSIDELNIFSTAWWHSVAYSESPDTFLENNQKRAFKSFSSIS